MSRLYAQSRDRTDVKLRLVDYRKRSRKLAGAIFYGKKAEKDQLYKELIPLAKRVVETGKRGCFLTGFGVKLKNIYQSRKATKSPVPKIEKAPETGALNW